MNIVGDATKARLIAAFIDNLFAAAFMLIVVALIPKSLPAVRAILIVVGYLSYFVALEATWSRTVGKYFQGLVVRKLDGSRCDLRAAIIRSLLRLVEVNPVLFGALPAGLVIIASERNQRLGDELAGTVVVSDELKWETDNCAADQPD